MATQASLDLVQKIYIAYYGRPADPLGQAYWADQIDGANGNVNAVITAFGNSAEATAIYGNLSKPAAVNALYNQLFGRDADVAGLKYYVDGLNNGTFTLVGIALTIANGALGDDVTTLNSKIAAANAFTAAIDTTPEIVGYSGDAAAAKARAELAAVKDQASLDAFNADTSLQNVINATGSETFTLTTGLDTKTANQFFASETYFNVDGKGPTINTGDKLTGTAGRTDNTLTITDLTPSSGGAANNGNIPAGVTLSNIQNVVLNSSNNTATGTGFSTVGYADVRSLVGTTNGGNNDVFTAKNGVDGTAVTVTHNGFTGNTNVVGGTDVTLTTAGGNATVGSPNAAAGVPLASQVATGAVVVNQNNTGAGNVRVFGGTTVNVTTTSTSNTGAINVGNTAGNTGNNSAGAIANASGNVTVSTAGTGAVTVFGGADVSVVDTALNSAGAITVGDVGYVTPTNLPTGNVTITETAQIAYNGLAGSSNNNNLSGAISVYGGRDVTITTNAANAINIGNLGATKENALNPTGVITVTNTGVESAAAAGAIAITGGTDVTVSTTGASVTIGRAANGVVDQASNPTGNVTVTETLNGAGFARTVTIDGGKDVNVVAKGQNVVIGNSVASAPTGAVTVNQADIFTGNTNAVLNSTNAGDVTVRGGTTVVVNTTGGNVTVGGVVGGVNAVPTGAVTITRTFSGPGADTTTVQGGTSVNITTTKTSGAITVGANSAVLVADGTALKSAALAPTGDVTIVNKAGTAYGTSVTNVNTNGAATVSITGGDVAAITDIQSTLATGGANSGKAIGTSKLATVVIDGLQNNDGATIQSDALSALTVTNTKGGANTITITNNTAAHALTITQGGNATGNAVTVNDAKAGSVTVTDNGTASTAALSVQAVKATALTATNAAAATINLAGDTELTSITLKGAGATTLQNVATLTKVATIDASASTGAVTTDLTVTSTNGVSQKFTGGSGVTTLTVNTNAFSYGDGVLLTGGTGTSDVLVANYAAGATDLALGNTASVKGFEILGLGANATSAGGNYDATGFSGVTLGAVAGNVTVTNMAKNASLSITAAPGFNTTLTPSSATTGTADALTINLSTNTATNGINAGTVSANAYEALTIVSNGLGGIKQAADNTLTLTDTASAGTGTLAISGQGKLTLTDSTTRFSSITVTNTDNVTVDAVAVSNAGAAITGGAGYLKATGATGGTEVAKITLGGTTAAATPFNLGDKVDATINGTTYTYTATAASSAATMATGLAGVINAAAIAGLTTTVSGGVLVLSSAVVGGFSLVVNQSVSAGTGTAVAALVGGSEEQVLSVSGSATATAATAINVTNGVTLNVNLTAGDSASTVATKLAAAINAVVASSTAVDAKDGLVSAVASGANVILTGGNAGVFAAALATAAVNGVTVAAGTSAINYATANDSFTSGSGGGTYSVGLGGSWSNTTHKYSSGSETINLAASAAKVDTLALVDGRVATNNGTLGGISGFTVGSLSASDVLTFGTVAVPVAKTALTNVSVAATVSAATGAAAMAAVLDPSGALLTALGNLTYTISNGVITFSATGGHSLSEFTTAQLISAAEILVNSASTGGVNKVAVFSTGGNSYVVASDAAATLAAGTDAKDTIAQLTGVASTTGFGTTGAQGTIVSNSLTLVNSNVTNSGSATVATYNEAGYSVDAITAGEFGTVSTSITNLAPSANLTLNGGAATLEAINISQTGTAGLNSLTLTTSGGDTFKSITTNGDGLLVLNPTAATIINSLVDGGSTNTLSTIKVAAGGATLDVKAITDTALTTIDSTAATAAVTFGSTTAIANTGVTFKLAVGQASTITASGANDVFTQGVAGSTLAADVGTGVVTLTASGAANTITLSNGANTITANGAGDTISVGTGSNTITATGAGDTINIASGAGTTSVTVGANATVNIGTANVVNGGAETIFVNGAVTGGTVDSFAKTTINFATGVVATNTVIDFDNISPVAYTLLGTTVANSQVNVAGAASLNDALNLAANYTLLTQAQGTAASTAALAANTGKITWFQYGGDTYVVAAVNDTAAAVQQTKLDANDVVVKLTGLVDLTGSTFSGVNEALTV